MEEYQNDVWDIVPRPKSKSVVSSKWIFKIKYVVDGSKARFVARGFFQKEGIAYEEIFSPVSRYTSIITIMALASMMKWDTFLTKLGFNKSKVDPNIYMKVMDDEPVILLLYADDLFLNGNGRHIIERKKNPTKEFKMKDIVLMHYFLWLEVW